MGAKIVNYLLEKSRVCNVSPNERNYHVFYQLATAADDALRKSLNIEQPDKYYYLNQSNTLKADGIDDFRDFSALQHAMITVGFSESERQHMMSILAGILHVGNIEFKPIDIKGTEGSEINDVSRRFLNNASSAFEVEAKDLELCLCYRENSFGKDVMLVPVSIDKALKSRDALAKALYGRLFDWLVLRVSTSLTSKKTDNKYIGILDIFGFERFDKNSFEQVKLEISG